MKKKLLTILLCACMALGLIACGSNEAESEAPAAETTETEAAEEATTAEVEAKELTIGLIIWDDQDTLSSTAIAILQNAADALNTKLIIKTGDLEAESQMKAAEDLIAAGVDGILCVTLEESTAIKMLALCTENNVAFATPWRIIADETAFAESKANEYYVAVTGQDMEAIAYDLMNKCIAAGITKPCAIFNVPGDTVSDPVEFGFVRALDEAGIEILAESRISRTPQAQDWIDFTQNFIDAYPECDAIIMSTGSFGGVDGSIATVASNGKAGQIQVATSNMPEDINGAMEMDVLRVASTENPCDPLFDFIVMYNYLQGTPIVASDDVYITPLKPFFFESLDDIELYDEYVKSGKLYSAEEIKNMTVLNNPDFTKEDLDEIITNSSIADLKARLGLE